MSFFNVTDKQDVINPSETTFCDLPNNTDIAPAEFVTFTTTTTTDLEPNAEEGFVPKEIEAAVEEPLPIVVDHEKQKVHTCEFCNRKYRTNEKLLRHVCKSAPVLDCQDDELEDDSEPSDLPQISHRPESSTDLFVCAVCFASFSQQDLFDQHTHTDESLGVELLTDVSRLQAQRKFTCGVCSEVYRSLARISYHVAHCSQGPYHCELCPYMAHTKQLLNRHKKKQHKGVESFFCTECGLGFKLRTSLQKHLVNRHESVQDHFPCDADGCGLVFSKKVQLTNHRIEVHGAQRKFLCQVCGNKFMTQDSLSSHLECHSNKRRFECQYCAKLFNTKEKLTLHVRTHTGEKPYVCDRSACSKSFISKSKLVEHIQRHNGEKRHKCSVCGKQYANKPDLRAHIRKLHGEHKQTTDVYTQQLVPSLQLFPVSVPQNMVITSFETVVTI
ncbi:gastrula zinc finger protein XlCGF26.1-like [Macrosteles quadrilineatus]|uniref:gastrula zinc finger protein XlCGF26.1-like n=1 Tax=Macrosteles quadrilineatus TaxID=74068 RepID=UPI0023E2A6BB|nr:gastrula zinc finger protein XlCGF26.1-like [Macrosteles quadrilineatus]